MAIFDTISFPPTDFVTGKPTIDGWTGNTDPGIAVHFPESGYATGGRISFAGGAIVPPVAFQCTQVQVNSPADVGLPGPLAAGSYLALGFFCTFDPTFDAADGISIAFLKDFAVKDHTTARRIDLLPNTDGVGAGAPGGGVDPIPGQAANYEARLNRDLAAVPAFWKGVGANTGPGTNWSSIAVDNCYAKAASWVPSTVQTTAGSGQTVPTTTVSASAPFTLAVVDVSQFPDSGNLTVPIAGNPAVTVAYTGRNTGTNTFTGCTVRKLTTGGSVDTAAPVQLQDIAWSVEVLVPTTTPLGGADWIDLQGHFGLYVNLFRVSQWQPQPPATPHAGFLAAQYRFPLPDASAATADQHYLTGFLDDSTYIGEDWYGRATITAITGSNDAQGICFQNVSDPASSVGVRHPGSADPTTLTQTIYGATGPYDNTIVAQIQNTNPANGVNNVSAEFRFGKWGNPPTAFAQWDAATAHGADPPNVLDLTAAGGATPSGEITSSWLRSNVGSVYAGDICLWVRLDSTDNAAFAQDGVRRNIIFTDLSEHSGDATISGSGYPAPQSGSHHDFLLMTHVRELVTAVRGKGETNIAGAAVGGGLHEDVQGWYWLVETFRRTGLQLTVGDTKAEVIDPSPGQFGALARHQGQPGDVFVSQLSGGGLKRSGNVYELSVPHDGEVTIHTWMGAGPAGTVEPPGVPADGGGCLGLLLPFLTWIKKLIS